ncbi:hypothetical protein SNE40_018363 [Patella caerulea]|uniref:Integrase zinc-binding domain-containing protein n=1 Tax=Patella caerulea TaxID=87958 RepID=A0AAN8PBD5_PATCE
MAALLGLRLAISVASVLDISVHLIVFWSDNLNVLWWVRGRGRIFKPFIGNRIGEVQTYTNPDQWRYVPTKENLADLVSRGQSVTDLRNSHLWWHGPTYLDRSEREWPENRVERSLSAESEVRKSALGALSETIVTYSMFAENIDPSFRLKPDRFSSWTRLKRVDAWVCRFIDNCRLPSSKRNSGELLPEEISDVEVKLIQKAQKDIFPDEYGALSISKELPKHSKLLALKPRIDTDGLMRLDGRLQNSEYLSYNIRYPIILPRKNWITKLIVRYYHEHGNHSIGTNQTLSALSTHFWLIAGREEIRAWESECAGCRRRKAKAATQIMAPLPKIRLQMPIRAFAKIGVDYAGPFIAIQGKGRRR